MTDSSNGVATYLGRGVTAKAYPLVVASEYGIPFLLLEEGHGHVSVIVFLGKFKKKKY